MAPAAWLCIVCPTLWGLVSGDVNVGCSPGRRPVCCQHLPEPLYDIGPTAPAATALQVPIAYQAQLPGAAWVPHAEAMVHGNDFVAVGSGAGFKRTSEAVENKYCLKVQTLGSREGCDQEISVLNEIIRYTPFEFDLEADPRHAERVVRDLGLEEAKASRVPGA